MKRSTYIAAIALIALLAAARVASTHRVFNATLDEPVHLVAGWGWIGGTEWFDYSHPPLARVLAAVPLRFLALPDPPIGERNAVAAGNFLLYHGDRYLKHLARARIGNLLLFVIAIAAVAAQANRTFGRKVAIVAAAIFTTLPPVLAHAGLVTTDMALTAALPLSLLALDLFLERATLERAIFLGASIAMGVLAKFSFFVFFPVCALVLIGLRRPIRTRLRAIGIAIITTLLVLWAGYRFDVGTIGDVFYGAAFFAERSAPQPLQQQVRWFADHVPIPAPALATGMALLLYHDEEGHLSFLMGEKSPKGWWYYFPVVFFFKTPLAFLALTAAGIALAWRRRVGLEHALIPLAILAVSMTASINIGVRHVLPMYAPLSILAAYALFEGRRRIATWALAAWLVFAGVATHPDYLAYFNEAAGKHPERIAVDSNLDWGQDMLRLERALRKYEIKKLWVQISTVALYEHLPVEAHLLPDFQPVSGWIAVGETPMALWGDRYEWLDAYEPVERIGKSIRLYYIP